jgi:hypothetical protein
MSVDVSSCTMRKTDNETVALLSDIGLAIGDSAGTSWVQQISGVSGMAPREGLSTHSGSVNDLMLIDVVPAGHTPLN